MSNRHVVVLTDEQRAKAFRAFWEKLSSEGDPELIVNKFAVAFRRGFDAALAHPEGITDDLLKLARVGAQDEWQRIGNDSNNASYGRAGDCGEAALRAALSPGDKP